MGPQREPSTWLPTIGTELNWLPQNFVYHQGAIWHIALSWLGGATNGSPMWARLITEQWLLLWSQIGPVSFICEWQRIDFCEIAANGRNEHSTNKTSPHPFSLALMCINHFFQIKSPCVSFRFNGLYWVTDRGHTFFHLGAWHPGKLHTSGSVKKNIDGRTENTPRCSSTRGPL